MSPRDDETKRQLETLNRRAGHIEDLLHRVNRRLGRILLLQNASYWAGLRLEAKMSVAMDNITREVAETKGIIESAIVLINGIADRIREAGIDAVKLEALTSELDADANKLAAAVAANTPVTTQT